MAKKQPVNVIVQIIISNIIPLLVLFACYRIEKLRWGVVIIAFQAFEGFILGNFFREEISSTFIPFKIGNWETDVGYFIFLLVHVGILGYVIGVWSKRWNEKVSSISSH